MGRWTDGRTEKNEEFKSNLLQFCKYGCRERISKLSGVWGLPSQHSIKRTLIFQLHFSFIYNSDIQISKLSCCLKNKINTVCCYHKAINKPEPKALAIACVS
jgi:hypothetical protein